MPLSLKQSEDRITTVLNAWETLCPAKTFAGFTLAQFKTTIQPNLDSRTSIATFDNQLIAAQNQRDDANKKSIATVQLVVNTTEGIQAIADSFTIRRTALLLKIPYYTTVAGAAATVQSIAALRAGSLEVAPLQSYT